MKQSTLRLVGWLLVAVLASCGDDGKGSTNPNPNPNPVTPPAPSLTTPVGTLVGSPVTQTIGASGGTVTSGSIKLEVLPGTVSGVNFTLQPITDTLNGSGQGIAISSDAAWSKYVKISFPIEPGDDSPEGLGLAVQQTDGSWLALEPVKVDIAAGTVTAGLSVTPESSSLRAQAGSRPRSVVKFKSFYLKPSSATVKVKKTQVFVPYAQVEKSEKVNPNCGKNIDPDDLAPLCTTRVTLEYAITNNEAGYTLWWVNEASLGNSTIGKISPNNPSGATYTAPDKKPNPDTVKVIFQTSGPTYGDRTLSAKVTIKNPSYRVSGSSSGGNVISGEVCDTNKPFTLNSQVTGISIGLSFKPFDDTAGLFSGSGSTGDGSIVINGEYIITSSENPLLRTMGTATVTTPKGTRTLPIEPVNATMTEIPPC